MLKNIIHSIGLSCCLVTSAYSQIATDPILAETLFQEYSPGFANLEHRTLGDSLELHWPIAEHSNALRLPNGLVLSYGEMVMFAGDMFGDADFPIANCEAKRKALCFRKQFEALAVTRHVPESDCENPATQVRHLRDYFVGIDKDLEKAKAQGQTEWDYYKANSMAIAKKLNVLTCGGSPVSDLFPFGGYISLANVNYDHFLPDAESAYKAGHVYALKTALKAHEVYYDQGDQEQGLLLLELAYAQNGFANHYLSDAFSAGHVRTPRVEMHQYTYLPEFFQLLLANLVHDEDNEYGLTVMNRRGDVWKTYGDGRLTMPEAAQQNILMREAMQQSVDAVYATFESGLLPLQYPELAILPLPESVQQFPQTSPLFKMQNGTLVKRVKDHDPNDYHWTPYWSGMAVLLSFYLG